MAVKVAKIMGFDVAMCNSIPSASTALQLPHCLKAKSMPSLSMSLLRRWLLQGFSQQFHCKCGNRHFICREDCDNIRMLAAFYHLKLLEKLSHQSSDRTLSPRCVLRQLGFLLPSECLQKTIPSSAFGQKSIDIKDVPPVLAVGRRILVIFLPWTNHGTMTSCKTEPVACSPEAWANRQKHGQIPWLSSPLIPLLWLLGW